MRKRDVVGRRIVDVRYARIEIRGSPREMETVVVALVLDNGREVRPFAFETDDSPESTMLLTPRLHAKEGA